MKLVFCNSNMIGSWIIRKLTFSRWSHVAIVDGDHVIEAVWPRVRRVPLARVTPQMVYLLSKAAS